jgi:cytoskeletal protein RodZ
VEDGGPARLDIGSTLKQTRQRLGLEIREVEDRTKIRIKYLRALENEEWDVLPAPAYVRGYLRAYADLLELDGEVLADEYRRQFEETELQSGRPVGGVLSERHREGQPNALGPTLPRGALVAGIGAAIVILIVILTITVGGR